MWTSVNMDAYLAVTCHFITEEIQLSTILIGVKQFIAEAKDTLMTERRIRDKVTEEMSTEKRVSGSKVIPTVKMLKHLASRQWASVPHPTASKLVTCASNCTTSAIAELQS
ncbi:Protein phosphatase PP2A regulatory subunit A [Labeo rohita]|uniref:Protein phosphatase PP2A regulatory subunit A n=1 Tax=Labeo rohita TaxID=84645 RepID=A0ABQ8L6T5_LABRO|nr:Protein phosphatase PP2A regulatory subunit A [Labeo rohita]